ncbi:MAG TPA: hypothetical protein HPP97_06985 [Desulfuromonadales bacterium]|nr:hypothetical protein [Desulfuromonadales bacterium]
MRKINMAMGTKSGPKDLTFCVGTPMNRVILGLNHYMSVGDYVGSGTAILVGDEMKFAVPVNINLQEDVINFIKLSNRLEEITYPKFKIEDLGIKKYASHLPTFNMFTISVKESDCDAFAKVLIEKPGSLGWGSSKALLDLTDWKRNFVA